ncbi:hypothetical protein [Deinococcus ruber]|uniref:Uncharacterized protein n=1 Tax=Deinococcus ruber TaxID=1848197 RepID=A0A918CE13_9DEIO|nr:hypothetical protein [Deinococcus ruber]GGR16408.1 hypothetical protein GCM10008957_31320 [Deinococcus ruber]
MLESLSSTTWTPAQWDALVATDKYEDALDAFTDLPDRISLNALVALASGDPARLQLASTQVSLHNGCLAQGARLLLMVDRELYSEVYNVRDDVTPRGSSEAELFDTANAAFAIGMAASVLGRPETSYAYHLTALTIAQSLGMTARTQHIAIELEAVRTVLGEPNPTRLRSILTEILSSRRFTRASTVLAEAYMALGDYRAAAESAPGDSDIKAFATALLGQPERTRDLLQDVHTGDYLPLAHSLMGNNCIYTHPSTEPEAGYERIIRSMGLTMSPTTAWQAVSLLGTTPPKTIDQLFFWSALLWAVMSIGVSPGIHPSLILDSLRQSVAAIPKVDDVGNALFTYCPEIFLLLGYMPDAHPYFSSRIMDIPFLAGNHVMFHGKTHKLPGKTGAQIFEDLITGKESKFHTEERRRFETEMRNAKFPRPPVNLAWVFRGLCSMTASMVAEEKVAWANMLGRMLQGLSGHQAINSAQKLIDQC